MNSHEASTKKMLKFNLFRVMRVDRLSGLTERGGEFEPPSYAVAKNARQPRIPLMRFLRRKD